MCPFIITGSCRVNTHDTVCSKSPTSLLSQRYPHSTRLKKQRQRHSCSHHPVKVEVLCSTLDFTSKFCVFSFVCWLTTEAFLNVSVFLDLTALPSPPSDNSSPEPLTIESRLKLDTSDFEAQERQRLAQEAKAERRQKQQVSRVIQTGLLWLERPGWQKMLDCLKKTLNILSHQERELVLKRIAEDRKSQQQKSQTGTVTEMSPPSGQGQRLGGTIKTNVDNQCILMVCHQMTRSFALCRRKRQVTDFCVLCLCRRFDCHPASLCVSASQPTPLCAAWWSTSPDAIPLWLPSLSSRVSLGNVSGIQNSLALWETLV